MDALEFYRHVVEAVESGNTAYAVTVVLSEGSAPQVCGAKMLVYADGTIRGTVGGGDVERKIIEDLVRETPRIPHTVKYDLAGKDKPTAGPCMVCGGVMEFLIEPLHNPHHLYIVGAGHCGIELSRLAKRVGFFVTVLDYRPEWANKEKHPAADRTICVPIGEIVKQIRFTPDTYIVIMTHGHTYDEDVLRLCVSNEFRYIGMLGSQKKARKCLDNLTRDGFPSDILARVHTPIGMQIGSQTPAEIAVSIAAELIAVRNADSV
ncbi:hypothetical protein EHM69_03600 [candidate division KSB1 bacterium]|nr:MAG: hypothetical protein EHM69_03600 [candidate division KSB1 bacterium]